MSEWESTHVSLPSHQGRIDDRWRMMILRHVVAHNTPSFDRTLVCTIVGTTRNMTTERMATITIEDIVMISCRSKMPNN